MAGARKFQFLDNAEFRKLPPVERAKYIRAVMEHLLEKLQQARPKRPEKRGKD